MNKIFLGFGANVGNKKRNINLAIKLLKEKVKDITVAPMYESRPVGYKNQANFLNTVLVAETNLSPEELLIFVKNIEKRIGRIKRFRWGPREIDIDILFYDTIVRKDENLEIPHPSIQERDFVLVPLIDLDPDYIHPIFGKFVKTLLEKIPLKQRSILQRIDYPKSYSIGKIKT